LDSVKVILTHPCASCVLFIVGALLAHARAIVGTENNSMNPSLVSADAGARPDVDTALEEPAHGDADRAALSDFDAWLAASPDREPDAGDELPPDG
jgi:hypothetical protein